MNTHLMRLMWTFSGKTHEDSNNINKENTISSASSTEPMFYLLYIVCVCVYNRIVITLSISSIDNMCVRSIALIWLTENSRPTDLSKTCVFLSSGFHRFSSCQFVFVLGTLSNSYCLQAAEIWIRLFLFYTWMLFMSTDICDDTLHPLPCLFCPHLIFLHSIIL